MTSEVTNFDKVFDAIQRIEMNAADLERYTYALSILGMKEPAKEIHMIMQEILHSASDARKGFSGFINEGVRAAEDSSNTLVKAMLMSAMAGAVFQG